MYRTRIAGLGGLTLTLAALGAAGCANWRDSAPMKVVKMVDIPDGVPWKRDKEPRSGAPLRMVATWTDAVRQQPGVPSERGFGGRIFFYDTKGADSIKVDGQLVVYAFDEKDRLQTDNRPTRKYVFPAEQFVKHSSESEVGLSYSVWLPWDSSGGEQTTVSLIARFEPLEGGRMIVSDQTSQRLPGLMAGPEGMIAGADSGVTTTSVFSDASVGDGVRTAGYQSQPTSAAPSDRGMETTTIRLPSKTRQ